MTATATAPNSLARHNARARQTRWSTGSPPSSTKKVLLRSLSQDRFVRCLVRVQGCVVYEGARARNSYDGPLLAPDGKVKAYATPRIVM